MTRAAEVIARITALAEDDGNYDAIVKQMHALAVLAPYSTGRICQPGTIFYRATSHHSSVPKRIEDVWFPPAERVTRFGRANRPGQPLFYCCSDPDGAFRELDVTVGQYVVLTTWRCVEAVIVHDAGYSQSVFRRAGTSRDVPVQDLEDRLRLSSEGRAVREFLAMAFTDPTATHYRITAAIAELLMSSDQIGGIIYPAVARGADVDNLALRPEIVVKSLELVDAVVALAETVNTEGTGSIVVARLSSVTNGDLGWEYTGPGKNVVPPNSLASIFIKPGERHYINGSGRIVIDGYAYDVRPGYFLLLDEGMVTIRDLQGAVVAPVSSPLRYFKE